MQSYDVAVIGGGPAGLAAAVSARESGAKRVAVIEREEELGGILNQCIHSGFGLHTFREELTGPEYAQRFIEKVQALEISCFLETTVLHIERRQGGEAKRGRRDGASWKADLTERTKEKDESGEAEHLWELVCVSRAGGLQRLVSRAVILAMGCRERPRGALNIPGERPAGIFSAGTAQRLVNVEGILPGKRVVILGSGDIGLIMARRMTLEGAKVLAVAELMPYCGGLKRNVVQCLEDFGIPLKLSHTVVGIEGKKRLEAVTLAQVDASGVPVRGTEERYVCDTLLLSVGLIPENELSRECGIELDPASQGPVVDDSLETEKEGIFACGNVLHVHDLVDFVTEEAAAAGRHASLYAKHCAEGLGREEGARLRIAAGNGVRYTVPSWIRPEDMEETIPVRFRAAEIVRDCSICVTLGERVLIRKKRRIVTPGEMETVNLSRQTLWEALEIAERCGMPQTALQVSVEEAQDRKEA